MSLKESNLGKSIYDENSMNIYVELNMYSSRMLIYSKLEFT